MKRSVCAWVLAGLGYAGLGLVGVGASASPAHAQAAAPTPEDIKAAGEAFDQGRRHFRAEEYVEAAEQFEAADMAAPSAAALTLALSSRKQAGQLDRAATLAQLALMRHPDDEKLKKAAEEVLAEVDGKLLEVTVICDEPCALVVGTRLVHGQPAERRVLLLQPGKHSVRAGWSDNRLETKEVQGAAGAKAQLSFSAPELPKDEPAAVRPPSSEDGASTGEDRGQVKLDSSGGWSPAVFWVGAGLTLVAGGVTVWSGIDTQNNPGRSRVKEECAGLGESCPIYQEGRDRQRRTNILAGATAGVGVLTVLIGAFLTDWSGGEASASAPGPRSAGGRSGARSQARVQPWVGVGLGDGATLGALGTF
ncbi:MAG: hypothetical protein KIT72_14555 [Polyangiaceae bacterium]|nr:hypothetical protein [Polyangiaceae bacterium]MCW5791635.1 hypothetical protein [Polyangiaceae bacterium]